MKEPRIFTSTLTNPPRYYLAQAWKDRGMGQVVITGKKWDVTDQIEAIIKARLPQAEEKP